MFVIYLGAHRWDLLGERQFIGTQNFVRLFTDKIFGIALKNTLQ